MGVKTLSKMYDTYVKKCKKDKVKHMDFIDFIMEMEG